TPLSMIQAGIGRTTDAAHGRPAYYGHTMSQSGRLDNLPAEISTFVGRERELAELTRALADARLVTLTGVGGVGKTRLGLRVAAGLADRYADSVCLVELASLSDQALVPRALATVLGLQEQPGRSVLELLEELLRRRHLLLVLDNCEHLVEACAALAEALL